MEIIEYYTALNLYNLNNKLLTIWKDYHNNRMIVAYDPKVSRGFCRHNSQELSDEENIGYRNKEEEFELDGSEFHAVWNYYKEFSPLRGYKKLEIFKNEVSIIKTEQGRKGPGMSYGSNIRFFLSEEENKFYLLGGGNFFDEDFYGKYGTFENYSHYLLSFDNFALGSIQPSYSLDKFLFRNTEYTKEQILPYVQTIWEVDLPTHEGTLKVKKTGVPNFRSMLDFDPKTFSYQDNWKASIALKELKFYLNEEEIVCSRPKRKTK